MAIPATWTELSAGEKRERLLAAAEALFARDGLDAPMPAIAAAAGAGVGSLYRQFTSKEDLVGALALKRLAHIDGELDVALAGDGSWAVLERFFWRVLEPYAADDLVARAIASAAGDTEVVAARDAVTAKLQRLLDATDAGVTTLDVHLVFVAARAARAHEPEAWPRMVTLVLAGLRAVNVR
jgi:AcrR family transcriptional regulator